MWLVPHGRPHPLAVEAMSALEEIRGASLTPAESMQVFLREIQSRKLRMAELLAQAELIDREMGDHLQAVRALALCGEQLAARERAVS
jgi:hypothetical protein